MSIHFCPTRKSRKWIFSWTQPVTKKKMSKSFLTQDDAEQFSRVLNEITSREKLLLRKVHKGKPANSKVLVKDLFEFYFTRALNNKNTIIQSRYHSQPIISAFGSRMVIHLSRYDIYNFFTAQRLRNVSQITANRRVSILKAAINWGIRNGILEKNPIADVQLPKASSRRNSPPTPSEAQAILKHSPPHIQRVIILGIFMGPRIGASELFKLTWYDIDIDSSIIRLPCAAKNDKEDGRIIPIRKSLMPILRAWLEHDKNLGHSYVINWRGNKVRSISTSWHTALAKANIQRRIRPYDLRHAFATYSLAAGADLKTVAEIMGHTDARMVLGTYQHVSDILKRNTVELLPDVLKLRSMIQIPGI